MVKLTYATCRHCGHKFIPRVGQPRQCGKCWKYEPLKPARNGGKDADVGSSTRKARVGR